MVADKAQTPVLGRYHIISENTAGAFGTVLIAWDPKLQRRVAIKRIPLISDRDLDKLGKAPTTLLPLHSNHERASLTSRLKTTLLPFNRNDEALNDAHDQNQSAQTTVLTSSNTTDILSNQADTDALSDVATEVYEPHAAQMPNTDQAQRIRKAARAESLRQQKLLQQEAQRVKDAALREARVAGMLGHPNIVLMHDFDVEDDCAYLIMEYIDGITLADLLDTAGQLNADVVAHIAQSVGNALGFAHENGVLHLDIKPENILIDRSGTVKIADFGMANLMSATGYKNARGGTVGYMPLEQLDLEELSEASDIFSFATVIYECLTDQSPFMASTAHQSRELLLSGAPDVLEISEEASEQTADLLDQGLSNFVAFRPVDAQAFGLALAKSLGSAKRGQATLVKDLEVLLDEACEEELLDAEISEAEAALEQARWLPGRLIYERPLIGEIILRSIRFACVFMAVWALMQAVPLEPRATLGAIVALVLAALSVTTPSLVLGIICAFTPVLLATSGVLAFMQHGDDVALLYGLLGATILALALVGLWFSVHLVRSSVTALICAPALITPGIGLLMITTLTNHTSSLSASVTPYSFTVSVSALGVIAVLCGLWLPRFAGAVVSGGAVCYGQLYWTVAHICAPSSLLAGFGGAPSGLPAVVFALMQACSTPSFLVILITNVIITLIVGCIMPAIRTKMWGFAQVQTYATQHQVPLTQLGILIRPTYPTDLMRRYAAHKQHYNAQQTLDEYAHERIDNRELSLLQAEEIIELTDAETQTNRRCWALIASAYLLLVVTQVVHIWQIIPHEWAFSSGNTTGFAINAALSMALCFILLILMFTLCGRALPVPSRKELQVFLDAPHQ